MPNTNPVSVLVVLCAAGMSLAACVDASVDPSKISARVVSVGEYALRDGVPVFTESRTKIPCTVGRLFGVDYELEVMGGDTGLLPVHFKWIHPEIAKEDSSRAGTETEGGVPNPVMERGESKLSGRSLYRIDVPSERVPGVYRFEIRTIGGNRTLLSQDFEIDGC